MNPFRWRIFILVFVVLAMSTTALLVKPAGKSQKAVLLKQDEQFLKEFFKEEP